MEFKWASFAVLILLFISSVFMVGAQDDEGDESVIACPEICYINVAYMTCPSTGDEHLAPACNCCEGGPGCSLFRANGEQIC